MSLETRADFARRLGVNRSTITRAAAAGRLVLDGTLVDVEKSLLRWEQTKGGRLDVEARHAADRAARGVTPSPAARKPATARSAGAEDEDEGAAGRIDHKATCLHYENEKLRLAMDLRLGARFPAYAVNREAHALGATLRSAIERLIDQTAPRLAVMTAAEDRATLLRAEAAALRTLIRGEFPRALRRLKNAIGKDAS